MGLGEFERQQAELIFQKCDQDNKGYITKNDLRCLLDYMAMDENQLEDVFHSLDRNQNGRLTLNEFLSGFGHYINDMSVRESCYGPPEGSDDLYDESFENIGVKECLEDVELVEEVYRQVKRENPALLPEFEKLLHRITEKLQKTKSDYQTIENELRVRKLAHDDEVRNLYMEVENQIKQETQRLLEKEKEKELQKRQDLEVEIQDKDRMFQEMHSHYERMIDRLKELESIRAETVQEKQSLSQERDMLQSRLIESETSLQDCQEYIEQLKGKASEDRKMRAKAVIDMNEGIAIERESLVRQLEYLRQMNRQLKDERDERQNMSQRLNASMEEGENLGQFHGHFNGGEFPAPPKDAGENGAVTVPTSRSKMRREPGPGVTANQEAYPNYLSGRNLSAATITRKGSTLAAYFGGGGGVGNQSRKPMDDYDSELVDDDSSVFSSRANSNRNSPKQSFNYTHQMGDLARQKLMMGQQQSDNSTGYATMPIPAHLRGTNTPEEHSTADCTTYQSSRVYSPRPRKPRPDSLNSIFKVVFLGDSAVGKTTIIQQFVRGEYVSNVASTVGVDFQLRSIRFDQTKAMLQLWDTAGQEKFRSITKQYYRKADGVVIVFDMTNVNSYLSVRNWMESLEDTVPENCTIMLLGNKSDLIPTTASANYNGVTIEQARLTAKTYRAFFHTVSGKTAENLELAFTELAKKMKLAEERSLENATVQLNRSDEDSKFQAKCCKLS